MKASIVTLIPDCTDLIGLRGLVSPGYRHCDERSNLTRNKKTKSKSNLFTDCFLLTNDGYPEIVALKQVPRNDGYLRNHFP